MVVIPENSVAKRMKTRVCLESSTVGLMRTDTGNTVYDAAVCQMQAVPIGAEPNSAAAYSNLKNKKIWVDASAVRAMRKLLQIFLVGKF
jgi:hypothetical protein